MKRLFLLAMIMTIYFMVGLFTDVFAQRGRSASIRFYEDYIQKDMYWGRYGGLDSLDINGVIKGDSLHITGGVTFDGVINGVTEYVAILTQSGTNAPSATVFQNTLGFVPVWTRAFQGNYRVTFTGGFPIGNCIMFTSPIVNSSGFPDLKPKWFNNNNDYMILTVYSESGETSFDDQFGANWLLVIRVYP